MQKHGLALAFVMLLTSGCVFHSKPKIAQDTDVTVVNLASIVERTWQQQEEKIQSAGLQLQTATLNAQIKEGTAKDGSVELLVFTAKAKTEATTSQSISVVLSPPGMATMSALEGDPLAPELDAAFARAITVSQQLIGKGGTGLGLDKVVVSIGFDVVDTVGGSAKLELGAIKVGPGVSASVSGSHKVELVFIRPKVGPKTP